MWVVGGVSAVKVASVPIVHVVLAMQVVSATPSVMVRAEFDGDAPGLLRKNYYASLATSDWAMDSSDSVSAFSELPSSEFKIGNGSTMRQAGI